MQIYTEYILVRTAVQYVQEMFLAYCWLIFPRGWGKFGGSALDLEEQGWILWARIFGKRIFEFRVKSIFTHLIV